MGNLRRWLPLCVVLVIGVGGIIGLVAYAAHDVQQKRAAEACPYEKYFEHQGGGVYHLELDKFFEDSKEELDTTRTTAKVIACWREAHRKEFRIVGITYALQIRYPPYIIIIEPVGRK